MDGNYDLAIVDDHTVDTLMVAHAFSYYGSHFNTWIGARDRNKDGTFHWVDGSVLTYSNWKTNEPNNDEVIGIYTGFSIMTFVVNRAHLGHIYI